jgi:hypothetical protein
LIRRRASRFIRCCRDCTYPARFLGYDPWASSLWATSFLAFVAVVGIHAEADAHRDRDLLSLDPEGATSDEKVFCTI